MTCGGCSITYNILIKCGNCGRELCEVCWEDHDCIHEAACE